jgi:hypothetical protein
MLTLKEKHESSCLRLKFQALNAGAFDTGFKLHHPTLKSPAVCAALTTSGGGGGVARRSCASGVYGRKLKFKAKLESGCLVL